MAGYLQSIVYLIVLWFGYSQVTNWLSWRALKKWGKQHNCGEPAAVKNKLPGGIERYALFFKWKDLDFLEDIIHFRYKQMGCYTYRVYNLFNRTLVSTAEPANVQTILATKFNDFDLGPMRRDNFYAMMGNGIFTAEGEAWAHYRLQLKPQFTRDQVSDLEAAERHLNILFEALPKEDEKGWLEVDIMPMIYRFTMDVSTEFLFGESVNSQSTASSSAAEREEDDNFAEAMNYAQEYIAWRIRLGSWYWLANNEKFRRSCKIVKDFADRFVKIALEKDVVNKKEPLAGDGKEKFVLLDALIVETRNPIELRDQILQILLAGRDTTSALLSWVILLLARQPEEFKKLRDTVLDQFGTEDDPKQELTFSSLKSCKELTHTLYETLRLYPLVPLNGRVALRDTFLPTGAGPNHDQPFAIRKGEQVGYPAWVMHRRKDIWGDDAEEWKPSRWEGRKLGWEFIGFSGGPRVCLGQQYALNEASFVLVKLVQRYDGFDALDRSPVRKGLTITLSPANGVKIKMHRAAK